MVNNGNRIGTRTVPGALLAGLLAVTAMSAGAEGTADRIGLTAAVGAGAAIAAHAAITAIKQARSKTANDQVSTVEK